MNLKKKSFLIIFLLILKSTVFALGDVSDKSVSMGLTIPFFYQNIRSNDPVEAKIFGVGLNFNYRQLLPVKKIGFFTDASVFMPISRTETYDSSSVTSKFTDYEYYFGIDSLTGIYSVLFRSGSISIPVGLGVHLDGMMSKYKTSESSTKYVGYTVGTGLWSNFEANITKNMAFFAGLKVMYDFYYHSSAKGSSNSSDKGLTNSVEFFPTAGVIFRL